MKTIPTPPQMAVALPSAPDAERAILKLFLVYPNVIADVRESLSDADFTDAKNRSLFRCIMSVLDDGDEPSLLSVSNKARSIAPDIDACFVAETVAIDEGGNDPAYLCRVLNQVRVRRELWLRMEDAASRALDYSVDPAEIIEQVRKDLGDIQSVGQEHIVTDTRVYGELCRIMVDNRQPETRHEGTATGFDWLDVRGGLRPTDLVIVAAESSQGKTSFALSVALNARLRGHKIGYFSLEMSCQQLCARLLAMQTNIPSSSILTSPLNNNEFGVAYDYAANLSKRGEEEGAILLDDRPLSSIDGIISSIRSMVVKRGISGAVVDFLQRLSPPRGMNREQYMGETTQRLKNLARELGVWIMALSQLSRDRDSPVPNLNRLRDSGQINEASDLTILLYRPEAVVPFSPTRAFPPPFESYDTKGNAMVTIAKGRNVGTGAFLCGFNPQATHFYEKPLSQIPTIDAGATSEKSRFTFR